MLVRTILLPSIFRVNPEKSHAEYGMVIRFLQNLEKNGIVLVDDTDCILAYGEDIKKWPQKFRTKAQELLIALRKKDRFVEKSLNDQVQANCQNPQCQPYIRMAKIYLPPAIISRDHCNECAAKELTKFSRIEVVDIAEYSISNFDAHLNLNDYFFAKGELTPREFEKKVLIPLLRDAKQVKIYDRYIGRSILRKENANQYEFTIKWILDVFLRVRDSKLKGVFEVYGGLNTRSIPKHKKIQDAIDALRALETDCKQVHPHFKLIIKDETKGSEMPHDRFLFTNQVAVSFGCGFNLLFGNPSLLRDVKIDYFSDPGKIEQEVRNLPDL
jgi:hypothetical protein